MVKIPTRESQGQLSTRTTANPIQDIGTFTQTSAAIERAGKIISQVADEFKRLQTFREVTHATIETNRQLIELEDKYLSDPNLSQTSAPLYQAEAQKIVDAQLATIGGEEERLRASVDFNGAALSRSMNVKRQGRDVDIDNANVSSDALEAQYEQESYQSGPVNRTIIKKRLEQHYKDRLAANLIEPGQANDRLAAFDERVRKGRGQFMYNALTSAMPGKTEQQRIKGAEEFKQLVADGEFSELTPQEEETLLKDADNFIKRHTDIDKNEREKKHRENFARDAQDILDEKISREAMSAEALLHDTYSDADVKRVENHFKDYKSPVAEGQEDINEVVRLEKINAGIIKKQTGGIADLENTPLNLGNRKDGTPKGIGYYGVLKNKNGEMVSEMSIGVKSPEGKEIEIPALVPGLTKAEIEEVISGSISESVVEKAVAHASKRFSEGKSPFAQGFHESKMPPSGIERIDVKPYSRRYTSDEFIGEVIDNTNGKLSLTEAKRLIRKPIDDFNKKEDNAYTQELQNLEARMSSIILRQYNEAERAQLTESSAELRSIINRTIYKFKRRVDEIENPTAEQINNIADDVFEEWKILSEEDGGAGMPPNSGNVSLGVGGVVKRTVGGKESTKEADVVISFPTKKQK